MKAVIVSLCDFSGNWSRPYEDDGYEVIRVDLKHGHDVRLFRVDDLPPVRGVLAAPPCTAFAGSGAQWWPTKDADGRTLEGLAIVDACLRIITALRPFWWALENPVGRLGRWIGPPAFAFDPCDYGDPYTKRTQLWGRFAPPLPLFAPVNAHAVEATEGSKMWRDYGGSSERTKAARSETPMGFARAFREANP